MYAPRVTFNNPIASNGVNKLPTCMGLINLLTHLAILYISSLLFYGAINTV